MDLDDGDEHGVELIAACRWTDMFFLLLKVVEFTLQIWSYDVLCFFFVQCGVGSQKNLIADLVVGELLHVFHEPKHGV